MSAPEIQLTTEERERWRRQFACQTPGKIKLQPFASGYQCKGCSGCCGTSHFELEKKIIQADLNL